MRHVGEGEAAFGAREAFEDGKSAREALHLGGDRTGLARRASAARSV
jgi:hypothetical protein